MDTLRRNQQIVPVNQDVITQGTLVRPTVASLPQPVNNQPLLPVSHQGQAPILIQSMLVAK